MKYKKLDMPMVINKRIGIVLIPLIVISCLAFSLLFIFCLEYYDSDIESIRGLKYGISLLILFLIGVIIVLYGKYYYTLHRKGEGGETPTESEIILRALIDNAPTDSIFLLNSNEEIVDLNPIAAERLGKRREELIGTYAYNALPEDIAKCRKEKMSEIFKTGNLVRFEDKRGDLWYDTVAFPIFAKDGTILKIAIIARDITARKNTEHRLSEIKERFHLIVDNVRDMVWMMDLGLRTTWISPSVTRTRGYTLSEITELPINRQIAPMSLARMMELLAVHITPDRLGDPSAEIVMGGEFEFYRKDGSTFWADSVIALIRDKNKSASGFLCVGRDITERRRAEEKLRESEERYRIAIEAANDGVAIVQNDIHIYVNRQFLNIFGYDSLDEIVGRERNIIIHPDYHEMVSSYAQARQKGEYAPVKYEFKGIRKDGSIVDIEVSVNTILHKGEKAILAYLRDISNRKTNE